MGSGKSANLLQARFNYIERGQSCMLLTAAIDDRFGKGKITSRIGISAEAELFSPEDDLFEKYIRPAAVAGINAIMVDEAQFLTPDQVMQLARGVDVFNIPTMCWGLRTDFRGDLFPGSATLLGLADVLRELKAICHCGSAARMVLRKDAQGRPTLDGDQVQIGDNSTYVPLCRKHWLEAHNLLDGPTAAADPEKCETPE
jgi:thymidine kinase